MQNNAMMAWLASSHLAGGNATYIEALYESYLQDATSVDPQWQAVFAALPTLMGAEIPHSVVRENLRLQAKQTPSQTASTPSFSAKAYAALRLLEAYRSYGHRAAELDPLKLLPKTAVPELDPAFYGLTTDDLQQQWALPIFTGAMLKGTLKQQLDNLKQIYCGSLGIEFTHLTSFEERQWFEQHLSAPLQHAHFSKQEQMAILQQLTEAEGLERYLAAKFPGAKRFSLEGADALIPMVKALLAHAAEQGVQEVVFGMAHRGRLNMLINVLGKEPAQLFAEFAGHKAASEHSGDVKYHQGYSSDFVTAYGPVHLNLAFNPSHLEIVNPVVMGMSRARQQRFGEAAWESVLPVTLHGDSAIAGQGVVQETFNMSQVRGYAVGGSVRIVINNQIGFTTAEPRDTRSTHYCTDIAKMVQAPILHVNADDPQAVVSAVKLAFDFRQKFKRDVVIDLVCYRRNGHNEADEPSATQPLMYQKIKAHPTARQLYASQLIEQGVLTQEVADKFFDDYRHALDQGAVVSASRKTAQASPWQAYRETNWSASWPHALDKAKLQAIGKQACRVPEFTALHDRVAKIYADRQAMLSEEKLLDWGMAEILAYATLLDAQLPVRLAGQDCGRGTFFHRHAVLHDQNGGEPYTPLAKLHEKQGHFQIYDSVLSEAAALAFEYGYAATEPAGLTIWEAQFGDFANGAQVVIDQFISAGEQKWGQLSGVTLLLPHGYEGQGPEHSSARLERYLQLCAQQNMQVCAPSNPAQIYHLLRRQALRNVRRPLIVITPKSLLRHPSCTASLDELASGTFLPVIADHSVDLTQVERVVLCSGKIYFELRDLCQKQNLTHVALVRVEQLYPFPKEALQEALAPYVNAKEWFWCQEEPQNQGAWHFIFHSLQPLIAGGAPLCYAGRKAAASPAAGSHFTHQQQQLQLLQEALNIKPSN
ncbi:MAG: 2-oxoglutarate dehydrogenase E1 component [Vibrionaceae bacterium]